MSFFKDSSFMSQYLVTKNIVSNVLFYVLLYCLLANFSLTLLHDTFSHHSAHLAGVSNDHN